MICLNLRANTLIWAGVLPDWVCTAGSTLLIPSGPQGNHLFIILTDPQDYDGHQPQSCISACVCTIRKGPYDKTCIIPGGSHPFINDESYVNYRYARFDQVAHLTNGVQNGIFFPKDPVDSQLLNRVFDGLTDSKQTVNFIKALIK